MISIIRATEKDYKIISKIGYISVKEAHKTSASEEDLNIYLNKNYNLDTIKEELRNPDNIYHILYYNEQPIGFSKMVLNAGHPDVPFKNDTKLDRIYLLPEFHALKIGYHFIQFLFEFAKENHQAGMWLYTWIGNEKAIKFYLRNGFETIGSYNFKVSDTHSNLNHHMLVKF